MRKLSPLTAAAAGIVLGGIAFNAAPANAGGWPVFDVTNFIQNLKNFAQETGILNVLQAMQTVQQAVNDGITSINKALGTGQFGDVQTLLQQG